MAKVKHTTYMEKIVRKLYQTASILAALALIALSLAYTSEEFVTLNSHPVRLFIVDITLILVLFVCGAMATSDCNE